MVGRDKNEAGESRAPAPLPFFADETEGAASPFGETTPSARTPHPSGALGFSSTVRVSVKVSSPISRITV